MPHTPLTTGQRVLLALLCIGGGGALLELCVATAGPQSWLGWACASLAVAAGAGTRRRLSSLHYLTVSAGILTTVLWMLVRTAPATSFGALLNLFAVTAILGLVGGMLAYTRRPLAVEAVAAPVTPLREENVEVGDVHSLLPWHQVDEEHSELDEDLEAEEPVESEDLVTQSWTRFRSQDGERLEGFMTIRLPSGVRQSYVHLPFSPPLPSPPQGWCECDGSESMMAEFDLLQKFGARLNVRRSGSLEDDAEAQLQMVLEAPAQALRAARQPAA
ncbi:hypothetical protein [Planctomicrobium sp. SH664]|uniref:hypothetical protein n=1 Tax=Planctomicrobium sp. SH664 TaxID=3448125 RepID=UPI003F5C579F